jgi:nitroreductase
MNETLQTIQSLRTIHGNFADKAIADQDLTMILEAAVRAANASARQSYAIIVVNDREMMSKLCGYSGARMLVFCVDFTRLIDTAKHLQHAYEVADVIALITGATDAILAAQTAAIAAKSLGIDSLFTNGIHRGDIRRVYDLLGLPDTWCFPLIGLVLGFPDKEPEYKKGRLCGPGVIHFERYHRITPEETSQLVDKYDDPQRHLGLIQNWNEQGFAHYLEWFYTKWSAGRTTDTTQFWTILRATGFLKPGNEV